MSKKESKIRVGETYPKGHPPRTIRRGDKGLLYLEDGTLLNPNIPVGPEEYHLQLFIEYERTFGRGLAKSITHDQELYDQPRIIKMYGKGFGEEYQKIAEQYGRASRGTKAEVTKLIVQIQDYRRKHPRLYEDAEVKAGTQQSRVRVIK